MSAVDKEIDQMISLRHHSFKECELMWKLHYNDDLATGDYFDEVMESESWIDES